MADSVEYLRRSAAVMLLTSLSSMAHAGAPTTAECNLDWTGQGATIVKLGGEVMVSQSPYVSAAVGMRVEHGGRVMTLDDSFAVVGYDDGCWHEMGANDLLTIDDVSPCCAPTPTAAAVPPPVATTGMPVWLAPAAIGAVATGAVVWQDQTDDDNPPSPRPAISP